MSTGWAGGGDVQAAPDLGEDTATSRWSPLRGIDLPTAEARTSVSQTARRILAAVEAKYSDLGIGLPKFRAVSGIDYADDGPRLVVEFGQRYYGTPGQPQAQSRKDRPTQIAASYLIRLVRTVATGDGVIAPNSDEVDIAGVRSMDDLVFVEEAISSTIDVDKGGYRLIVTGTISAGGGLVSADTIVQLVPRKDDDGQNLPAQPSAWASVPDPLAP